MYSDGPMCRDARSTPMILPKRCGAVRELHDLAHGTRGRDVGLSGGTGRNEGEEEGQEDREHSVVEGHLEVHLGQDDDAETRHAGATEEPRVRDLHIGVS